jgi:uncharacterized protein YjbI with pentapeptide repeats
VAKPTLALQAPRLDVALNTVAALEVGVDDDVTGVELRDVDCSASALDGVSFLGCRFVATRFTGTTIMNAHLLDVAFVRCDLAGVNLSETSFMRVHFDDCRVSSGDLSRAEIRSVLFAGSRLDDVNLRHTRLEAVKFHDCNLVASDFMGATLTDVAFGGSDVSRAEFSQCAMQRVDLRRARVEGLRGVRSLAGATLSLDQAMTLAPALASAVGLVVKAEDGG